MDETPEELEQIRREAEAIDPHRYRRRYRLTVGVLILALCTGVTWVAIQMALAGRNPCERVRDYFCKKQPNPAKCSSYQSILKESVQDSSPSMRSMVREQCLTKINRLKQEDGVTVE